MWITINIEENNIECSEVLINLSKIESISNLIKCKNQPIIELVVGKGSFSYFWKFETEEECNEAYENLQNILLETNGYYDQHQLCRL